MRPQSSNSLPGGKQAEEQGSSKPPVATLAEAVQPFNDSLSQTFKRLADAVTGGAK